MTTSPEVSAPAPAAPATQSNWKNVNNWHWVEKNCYPWALDFLTTALKGQSVADPEYTATVTGIKVEGDVHLNQRKGKILTIFDLRLDMSWEGSHHPADGLTTEAKGSLIVEEFEHDQAPADIEFHCSAADESGPRYKIKEFARKKLADAVRARLATFSQELIQAHVHDVRIPEDKMKVVVPATSYAPKPPAPAPSDAATPAGPTLKGGVTSLTKTAEFVCSADDLYTTLTVQARVEKWTRGPAQVGTAPGSPFRLFGGNISGTLVQSKPNELIEWKWRAKTWPENHFSKATLTLKQGSESTTVSLTQSGVPVGDKESTLQNWDQYYFNPIKQIFGYGVVF